MSGITVGTRASSLGRFIALRAVFIVVATACDKDSSSPGLAPGAITVTAGAAQTAVVNTALASAIAVLVTDASGNPLAGVSVSFTPSSASGSVSATQVTTDATGTAQVTWTLGTVAGADSLAVSVGTLTPITAVATATPDIAAAIAVVSGNDQSAPAGTTLASPLSVKVTDKYGNAVPNATVSWTVDNNGVLTQATTVTDQNGVAQDVLALGPSAGNEDVVAMILVNSAPVTASFTEDGM
ncbi:MAG TPA: Ig-like domain-containing protein [Gemmatimonadaceae bacterium]|nr:Ig-like domain-containing protein [Gemmatimonadaceae bacterium]